jgi:hypothetical protein
MDFPANLGLFQQNKNAYLLPPLTQNNGTIIDGAIFVRLKIQGTF